MRYLDWGEDGRKVSVMGIGCMRMDDLKSSQVDAVVDAALGCGINFFDHADIGLSREEWYELYRAAGNELP